MVQASEVFCTIVISKALAVSTSENPQLPTLHTRCESAPNYATTAPFLSTLITSSFSNIASICTIPSLSANPVIPPPSMFLHLPSFKKKKKKVCKGWQAGTHYIDTRDFMLGGRSLFRRGSWQFVHTQNVIHNQNILLEHVKCLDQLNCL